ncbi:MAG: hypothetical protein ACI4DP_07535 [Candidatus Ornithomonoglobus sp.]
MRVVLIAFLLVNVFNFISFRTSELNSVFHINQKNFEVISSGDTHGGFVGDGDYYLILDCSKKKEKALKAVSKWNKLPMTENLNLIMYGGERDGVTYGYELAENAHMPYIENGYYYFLDRHRKADNIHSDKELFDRASFNFSIAVYDTDTDLLYYYRFDT